MPITESDLLVDLETIAGEIREERFDLWATTYAGPVAIRYAVEHLERIDHLVLDGTFGAGREFLSEERAAPFFRMLSAAHDDPEMVYASLSYMTDPDPEQSHEVRIEHARNSISTIVLEQLYRVAWDLDVRHLLRDVKAPTLVLHRRGSRSVPYRSARRLAAALPDSMLVLLSGSEHNIYEGNWRESLAAIAAFLHLEVPDDVLRPQRDARFGARLLTVLFTDIVGSTQMTSRLGDSAAQEFVRGHDAAVRQALQRFSGTEIKHTGDGIMACFDSVTDAADAALVIADTEEVVGERTRPAVRIGLNAGEPLSEDGDLFGSTVQIAARVCDQAAAGEILVSDVVRQLARGKGLQFVDCGLRELRGVEEPIRIWRLAPVETGSG